MISDECLAVEQRFHYPNVPNLHTHMWESQYFSRAGYERLQAIKSIWDREGVFSQHPQSIAVANGDDDDAAVKREIWRNDTAVHRVCRKAYDANANKLMMRAAAGGLGLSLLSGGLATYLGRKRQIISVNNA